MSPEEGLDAGFALKSNYNILIQIARRGERQINEKQEGVKIGRGELVSSGTPI